MKGILHPSSYTGIVQKALHTRSLPEAIDAAYARLSPSQRKLAEYLLASYDDAAFLTSTELARRLKTSDSTVVRFARALGYRGYPALRAALADLIRAGRTTHSGRMASALQRLRTEASPLARLLDQDLAALGELRRTLSPNLITEIARRLRAARTVYVLGLGISRSLAHFVAFRLRRTGMHVETITHGGTEAWEVLFRISRRDVMLAVGFFRGYQDIVRALRYARGRGVHTIVFTDTPDSPLAAHATRLVVARRGDLAVVNSLVVPMAMLNLLTVAVALQMPDDAVGKLQAWDRLRAVFEDSPPQVHEGSHGNE
ncbi:MAG: MurR/RpiR family transcriptional regulator [bacterium]|nr:MurR/RpiR family transcriptional regulator [bacterium]